MVETFARVSDRAPEWMVGGPGTFFSALAVNVSFPQRYHMDRKDLDGTMSCIAVKRRGHYEGGMTCIPEAGTGTGTGAKVRAGRTGRAGREVDGGARAGTGMGMGQPLLSGPAAVASGSEDALANAANSGGLAFDLQDGDILALRTTEVWHGVSDIVERSPDAARFSFVCYATDAIAVGCTECSDMDSNHIT